MNYNHPLIPSLDKEGKWGGLITVHHFDFRQKPDETPGSRRMKHRALGGEIASARARSFSDA